MEQKKESKPLPGNVVLLDPTQPKNENASAYRESYRDSLQGLIRTLDEIEVLCRTTGRVGLTTKLTLSIICLLTSIHGIQNEFARPPKQPPDLGR